MDDKQPDTTESESKPDIETNELREELLSDLNHPLTDAPDSDLPAIRNFVSFNTSPLTKREETQPEQPAERTEESKADGENRSVP